MPTTKRPSRSATSSDGNRNASRSDGIRKVTLNLPRKLLQEATAATGRGITPTIQEGLRLVAASRAFDELRSLRGTLKLSIDWKASRED